MRLALIASACLASACQAQDLSIAALRIGTPDIAASAAFYERHLGFERLFEGDYIVLMNDDDYLVITPGEQALAHSESCYARLNFVVPDLDHTIESLKNAGAIFVSEDSSAVGRFATFLDPGGHRFNVKQLDRAPAGLAGPRLYNVGISVFDMDDAIEFYEGVLGFDVRTKDYYPPVVVFQDAGPAYFILSDKTVTAPSTSTDSYFTGLAFETTDIEDAMRELAAKGVVFVDETPELAGDVLHATFRDPFGNVHELIEHVSTPGMQSLSMLEGRWVFEFNGGLMEEVWLSPTESNLTGTMRQIRNGTVNLVEVFTITKEDDGSLVYRLRHFDADLTPWKSEAAGPITGVIEEATGDRIVIRATENTGGVKSLTYERTDPDTLIATLEFEDADHDRFVLTFKRQ